MINNKPNKSVSFNQLIKGYRDELKTLQERKMLLGTGSKGTNIEVQLDKTIAQYQKTINSLSRFESK